MTQSKEHFSIRQGGGDETQGFNCVPPPKGYKGVHIVNCPRDNGDSPNDGYNYVTMFFSKLQLVCI